MTTREPEVISGSTKLSRSQSSAQREQLAKRVEKLVGEALNMYDGSLKKLRELTPMIAQLRQQFMKLKPGETIARCRIQPGIAEAQPEIATSLKGQEGASPIDDRRDARSPRLRMDAGVGRRHFVQLRVLRF